jgi:hypothetical protein
MTHAYFINHEKERVGTYVQRLLSGAMAALVIFIVAKAGVPIITDPSRLGGQAPINPYFVSFLAIISGLLSENAMASVQTQGARFFGSGAQPDRWVRDDLSSELQLQGLSLGQLAEYLCVSESAAASMLKGEDRVSAGQQQTIALFLRRNPREIFTDIPPEAH